MPDRQKRKKNNKNKRKNKNQRPTPNTSSADVNESVRSGTCSGQNTTEGSINDTESVKSECEPVSVELLSVPQTENTNTHDNENKIEKQYNNKNIDDTQTPMVLVESENVEEIVKGNLIAESYVVESPENSLRTKSKQGKLDSQIKSKSLDNDDAPKIVEILDEASVPSEEDNTIAVIENNNILVTDVESDVEWEKTDEIKNDNVPALKELATSTLSIATIPFNIAECKQTKALTPEAEQSLRKYLKTLNLSTHPSDPCSIEIKTEIEQIINREIKHRLRKKGLADDFLCPRLGPPRVLDVIDEEGSSESSATSRRHSYLNEKKSDYEDLEDEVFEDNKKIKEKYSTKSVHTLSSVRQIPQKCVLVGAKIKEPEITEARGDWSMKTVEKMTGAELVYLTDTSSSTSSIHDIGEETDDGIETDVSIRMITPTIEVTDTENFLKRTFTEDIKKEDKFDINSKQACQDHSEVKFNGNKDCSVYSEGSVPCDHEIVVLSTEDIKTNLYVKGINETENEKSENTEKNQIIRVPDSSPKQKKSNEEYDLEMKVLKCELNDAINNLIKEVASDSETTNENPKDSFARQDSASSVCSSQCTAKYNPTYSSLNDVSNLHEETCESNKANVDQIQKSESTSHVKDVFECVAGTSSQSKSAGDTKQPDGLRDLCVKRIATLPYGEKILEELASVSERLQSITVFGSKILNADQDLSELQIANTNQETEKKMPYFPLPDVSTIETVSLETKPKDSTPPVQPPPRRSSLKKSQDEHWTGLPTKTEPVYVCLSPSQKMLMEKTNTVITKENASQLVDMHKKFVDRRGYNECKNVDREKSTNPPVVPFKSQTGSRLLALIRDPTVTSSINTSISKSNYQSVDHIEKSFSRVEQMSKRIRDQFNSIGDFSSFKPIPPPRPRKYSSSVYESDESDFTDSSFRSMQSERKYFHYSTGNLNKDIENDISTIQNMHRHYTNMRDQASSQLCPRRPSLPKDLCDQQMEYIRQKEKEVEAEIKRLEEQKINSNVTEKQSPKAPLITEKETFEEKSDNNSYHKSHKTDVTYSTSSPEKGGKNKLSSAFSSSQEEILRDKMYSEYMSQMAERQERKQHKVIKITNYPVNKPSTAISKTKSMPAIDDLDSKVNNRIEKDFILKARERWEKLGIKDPETEDEIDKDKNVYKEPKVIKHKIKVIEGDQEKDVQKLPTHLQDFVRFTAKEKQAGASASGSGESGEPSAPAPAPASTAPHVVLCAVILIVVAVVKYFIRLFRFNY